jgi:ureidoacrylate peracid hydrolase
MLLCFDLQMALSPVVSDLDLQLKQHGIHRRIVRGLIAHTAVKATIRYAAGLGYDVTMVKDATADYSNKEMRAALEINIPNYASDIVSSDEIVTALSSGTGAMNRQK